MLSMWIHFFVAQILERVIFNHYQVQDELPVELPEQITSPELIEVVLQKGAVSLEELMMKGSVKINVQMSVSDKLVLQRIVAAHPTASPTFATDVAALLQALRIEQQQVEQQNAIIQTLMLSFSAEDKRRRPELIKPDVFNGHSTNPEGWIAFYKYASERNAWTSGEDRVQNVLLLLGGVAKQWYELRLADHAKRALE